MRGGTSKGLFFRWEDLPAGRDAFLCAALGAGDAHGRQLDGMGGGVSSLSKAMMVRRSTRAGVDVDYLFAQVGIREATVDYAGNCGNLSAAVGAYAVDQGLVQLSDGPGVVRMFNENTAKRIDCHLTVRGGRAATSGAEEIAGVTGQGSAIRLAFLDPGGAGSGALMPGARQDMAKIGVEEIPFSFVDAANPCVFVAASDLGLTGTEMPTEIAADPTVLAQLERVRQVAGRYLQGSDNPGWRCPEAVPKIAMVANPGDGETLSGQGYSADECDIQVRMISMGQPHLAIPLTGAMCTAVAARIPGTVVAGVARPVPPGQPLRIATPSGIVPAMADVDDRPHALSASVYRTARTLMEGEVLVERARMEAYA